MKLKVNGIYWQLTRKLKAHTSLGQRPIVPAEPAPIALRLAAVAIAIAFVGCASPKTATPGNIDPGANLRSAANGKVANPDLLLAEALRQYITQRDAGQALAMAQLAVTRAPERADATWLLLQICSSLPSCQPEPIEARLRKLDPANGAVWLGALQRTHESGDTAAEDQILEALGRSKHINVYWNSLVAKLSAALAERTRTLTPENKTPLSDALNENIGLLSRVALPAFQPAADSCSARRLGNTLVAARCLLAADVLQRSDTYVAESIGLGIAERLAAADGKGTAKVEQRIATTRYQRDTAGEIMTSQLERERFAGELLELMRKQPREQDIYIAIIRWAGRPLLPAAQP